MREPSLRKNLSPSSGCLTTHFHTATLPAVVPNPPNDRRPPLVVAMQMVSQITSIAVTMVLPAGLGYWGDHSFGTKPWLTVTGAVLGGVLGMIELLQLVKVANKSNQKKPPFDDRNRDGK